MNYDHSFDQARLNLLADQYLKNNRMTGQILFFGDPEENRLDLATWQLDNDEDFGAIKGSDFKLHVMELLDTLLIYRAQHGQPNANQGVVHMDGRALSVNWLPKAEVEAMRNS